MQKTQDQFINYYQNIFGSKTGDILEGLKKPTYPILSFKPEDEKVLRKLWKTAKLPWKTLSWYKNAILWPKNIPPKTALPGFYERKIFAMNASSLIPVLALNPQPSEVILDACAAPGAKAMLIANAVGKDSKLIVNDLSKFRRNRMNQLLSAYEVSNIEIFGKDANYLHNIFPEIFDKILLDAPCSSEKHVYNSAKYLKNWKVSRVKILKKRQYQLILNLLKALKPGGILVYSTCAVTPEENEEVVTKIVKKGLAKLLPQRIPNSPAEKGMENFGLNKSEVKKVRRILPGKNSDLDPMFVAILQKV